MTRRPPDGRGAAESPEAKIETPSATPTASVAERLDRFELDFRPTPPSQEPIPPPPAALRVQDLAETTVRSGAGVTTLEHPRLVTKAPIRHVLAPTNDLIDRMWTANRDVDAIDGWTPQELDTDGSATARRVFIGTVLSVGLALLVASAWFLAGRGDATVEATLADIDDASAELAEVLVATEAVISDLSTGELDDREAAAASSTAIDATARTLFNQASNLPTTEEWADVRSTTVSLSDRSIATARLLARTTSYIATTDVMFNRPAYPLTADDAEIGDIAEMTAVWVSRFIATASSLPAVNTLEPHRLEIDALAAELSDWQSTYLDALRAGDVEAAGSTVGELEDAILGLEVDLAEAVRVIAEDLAERRSTLLADLQS